jgi:hypothetical protein
LKPNTEFSFNDNLGLKPPFGLEPKLNKEPTPNFRTLLHISQNGHFILSRNTPQAFTLELFNEPRSRINIAYLIYALLSFIQNDHLRSSYLFIVAHDKKLRRIPPHQLEGIFLPNLSASYLKELPLPILIQTLSLYLKDIFKNMNSIEYVRYCSILIFYSKENIESAYQYFDVGHSMPLWYPIDIKHPAKGQVLKYHRTPLLYYIDIKHPVNGQALKYIYESLDFEDLWPETLFFNDY